MARGDRSSTMEPEASTSSDKKETDEERSRRRKDEDMIIARAKAIREKIRALDARANVKTHDESHRKSHWEYVLTEMTWLARDFASERDWKQETSRQVSHLAASCDGNPVSAEDAELNRRKVRCAMVAAEIAAFWADAWERAKEKPLPHADELVDVEDDKEDEGDDDNDEDDADTNTVDTTDEKSTPAPKAEVAAAALPGLATTPPPPPGMRIISSWASNKLYLAMVEMKRDLVRDAIEIKEAKDAKERQKAAKKTTKKAKAAVKPTRGRGGKKKDEPEDGEEDDDDDEDSPTKSDKHPRITIAEALEMDGMDMDMGLLAPTTPPLVEEFIPIIYDAVPLLNERVYRDTMQIEAHKFAEYERSLRGWEENERKRARALVEAARFQAEEEAYRETMEQRRTFLAAAAVRGFYFDEEGYMVDAKGKRKKNKRGEWIQFGAPGHEADMDFGVPIPKRTGGVGLDGKRIKDKKKRKAGAMRPWSPMEDQLLCAIVHEFGSNWALITDAFAASTPIKGVYHRIEHCRWRFSHLTQVAETEHDENAIAALNLDKGSARSLIARALPVEDETVRIHFDRSCAVMAKHMKIRKAAKVERVGMDKARRMAPHRSWRDVQAICGGILSPVELADQALMMAPAGNNIPAPMSMSPGAQRLGTMLPMMPPRGAIPPGGMPASAAARGSGKTPSKKKTAGKELQQLQLMGSYSPAAGGAAMQLGGIGGSMPSATGSKSPALAPGSYNIGGGGRSAPAVKRTTATKRKAVRKK